MRGKNTSKKTEAKAAPEEKTAAVELGPVPAEAAAAAEAAVKDEKPARKRSVRKPKDVSAESMKKPRIGRKAKAEVSAAEPVKKSRTAKKDKPMGEPAPEEKKPRPGRRGKVDMPAELGVFVQFQGGEVDVAAIAEAAKADFKAANKRAKITSLKLYVKPEENTAYYVVNDSVNGKVTF